MNEYLRFENAIFCSRNCNFLSFSAHNLSLLLISTLCLNLIVPNITPGGLFSGGGSYKSINQFIINNHQGDYKN